MEGKNKITLLVIMIFFIITFIVFWENKKFSINKFSVTFFNIGQGDSALIKFRNGQKMLVDCGPDSLVLDKLGDSLSFFDRTIDYLVVTHPDLDHYGGCPDVLNRYQVKNIIVNSEKKEYDSFWKEWNNMVFEGKSIVKIVTTSYDLEIAQTNIYFLFPASTYPILKPNSNNDSLLFKLLDRSSNISVLFTGDIEIEAETSYRQTYCPDLTTPCPYLRAKYLKVAHHGSDSSSSEDWLNAIRPEVAIISVGKNKFGHPSLRVWRHLERIGAEIWRTDQKNDIIVSEK